MASTDHRFQDDRTAVSPAVGHYEDLLAFQRQTIQYQSQVIEQLTSVIGRISAPSKHGDADAQIINERF